MERSQVVVNTIGFMEQLQKGSKQYSFFKEIADLGIKHVEVRQEYFSHAEELEETAVEAEKYGLQLLYSVPKQLFHDGHLDTKMVEQTIREAKTLSAAAVKWTRGDFHNWNESDTKWIHNAAVDYRGLLTVENDQTQEDGTLENYMDFLLDCQNTGVPLFSTFDVGNWVFVGEDPVNNARQLESFVRYIHVKDVTRMHGVPTVLPLGMGELPLQQVFSELPQTTLVALEYPCDSPVSEWLETGVRWLENLELFD